MGERLTPNEIQMVQSLDQMWKEAADVHESIVYLADKDSRWKVADPDAVISLLARLVSEEMNYRRYRNGGTEYIEMPGGGDDA